MTNKVRAKFQCDEVAKTAWSGTRVKMSAVYSDEGENKDFTDASPMGEFEIHISDGYPAADYFTPGKEYYFDIHKAPDKARPGEEL